MCVPNSCQYKTGQCAFAPIACPVSPGPTTKVFKIAQNQLTAGSGVITFAEKELRTQNPSYTKADYGAGTITFAPGVTTGGYFHGQALSMNAARDCPGGAATGCVAGLPTSPLSLDPNSPKTFIRYDDVSGRTTNPVLSGGVADQPDISFSGPIALLFSTPVVGFGVSVCLVNSPIVVAVGFVVIRWS